MTRLCGDSYRISQSSQIKLSIVTNHSYADKAIAFPLCSWCCRALPHFSKMPYRNLIIHVSPSTFFGSIIMTKYGMLLFKLFFLYSHVMGLVYVLFYYFNLNKNMFKQTHLVCSISNEVRAFTSEGRTYAEE